MTDKGTGQLILGVDQVILSIDQIKSKSQTQFSLEDCFISSVLAELNPHLTDFKLPFALFQITPAVLNIEFYLAKKELLLATRAIEGNES